MFLRSRVSNGQFFQTISDLKCGETPNGKEVHCTDEFDPCRAGRRPIMDNSHSLETTFFHAMVGLADSFPNISYLELHRCASCGTMRIGRAVEGFASAQNSFIRAFVKAANVHIAPNLSGQAKSKGFYAAISTSILRELGLLRDDGPGKWFEQLPSRSSLGGTFISTTNVNGRYLQNYSHVCGGDPLTKAATEETSRYLHVEQQGGFSIKADQHWEAAINSMENSVFVQEHKTIWPQPVFLESDAPTNSPTTSPTYKPTMLPTNAPTLEPTFPLTTPPPSLANNGTGGDDSNIEIIITASVGTVVVITVGVGAAVMIRRNGMTTKVYPNESNNNNNNKRF